MLGAVEEDRSVDAGVVVDTMNVAVLQPGFPEPEWAAAADGEQVVRNAARANIQLLADKLFALPRERVGDIAVTTLTGTPLFPLPRRLPLPKPQMPTRWEAFAKERGIKPKRKRERMMWDEQRKEYRPIFGYKRANEDVLKPAVIEVKDNDPTPFADPFDVRDEERAKARAKQRSREARNIAERDKGRRMSPGELRREMRVLDKSTASLGNFPPQKEKKGIKSERKRIASAAKKRRKGTSAGVSAAKRRRKGK